MAAGYEFTWERPEASLKGVAVVREYRITQNYSQWTVGYHPHGKTRNLGQTKLATAIVYVFLCSDTSCSVKYKCLLPHIIKV